MITVFEFVVTVTGIVLVDATNRTGAENWLVTKTVVNSKPVDWSR